MEEKEKETTGFWLTEEKMKKSGDYSTPIYLQSGCSGYNGNLKEF